MKKMRILFFLLLLCFTSAVIAQNKQITGKVINKETGAPLEGLSVVADKTTQGVVTKADGTYSISVNAKTTSLVFSYVGFETKIVSIGTKKNIDVEMPVAIAEGSEVVVVGYGTRHPKLVSEVSVHLMRALVHSLLLMECQYLMDCLF